MHLFLKSWFYVLHWILLFLFFFKTYHFRFFSSFGSIQHSICHSQKSQKSSDLHFLCSQSLKKKRCMCYVDCNRLRKKNLQNGFQKKPKSSSFCMFHFWPYQKKYFTLGMKSPFCPRLTTWFGGLSDQKMYHMCANQ